MKTSESEPVGPTKEEVIEIADWFLEVVKPEDCARYYHGEPSLTIGRFGLTHKTETVDSVELRVQEAAVPMGLTVHRHTTIQSFLGFKPPRSSTIYQVIKHAPQTYANAGLTSLEYSYRRWFFWSDRQEVESFGKKLSLGEYWPQKVILLPDKNGYTYHLRNIVQVLWQGLDAKHPNE